MKTRISLRYYCVIIRVIVGLTEMTKLPYLSLLDNPLSKYLIFERVSCMQWLF